MHLCNEMNGNRNLAEVIEVLVKCPVTGLGLDAGVTEEELLTEISSLVIHTVNCPLCYTTHTWRKRAPTLIRAATRCSLVSR